jgi:Spy/CpxP family protein refolding chaperone
MKSDLRRQEPEENSRSTARMRLVALMLAGLTMAAASPSPYAGQETRDIKALSSSEVADLLAGRGMGLAKAGELNGYPGPAHVLELSEGLELTAEQRRAVDEIHAHMTAAAKPLGAEIVRREHDLDDLFADGGITEPEMRAETAAIAELDGRLRAVHLAAHLATKAVLTPTQIARYEQLRGYAMAPAHDQHDGGHHHAD